MRKLIVGSLFKLRRHYPCTFLRFVTAVLDRYFTPNSLTVHEWLFCFNCGFLWISTPESQGIWLRWQRYEGICKMSSPAKLLDPAFQSVGQRVYPIYKRINFIFTGFYLLPLFQNLWSLNLLDFIFFFSRSLMWLLEKKSKFFLSFIYASFDLKLVNPNSF